MIYSDSSVDGLKLYQGGTKLEYVIGYEINFCCLNWL